MKDIKLAGKQNFSILGLMVKAVGVAQILRSTATARDRQKFFAQIIFFSYKKSLNVKISNKFFYFPHISCG
jgi:hypothetical protein